MDIRVFTRVVGDRGGGGGYQAQRKKTGMLGDFLITPCIRRKFAEAFEMRITLVNRKVAAMNRES